MRLRIFQVSIAILLVLSIANTSSAALFTLDFTVDGNAALDTANNDFTSPQTIQDVSLGGGITVDVTISASPTNIHFQANNGLGVLGGPPPTAGTNQMGTDASVAESLTIGLSDFQGTAATQYRFTAIQTGDTIAPDGSNTINLNDGEMLNITTSALDNFDIAGSNASLVHNFTQTSILPSGGSYVFSLRNSANMVPDSMRISQLQGELFPTPVPEPSSLCLLVMFSLCSGATAWCRSRKHGIPR